MSKKYFIHYYLFVSLDGITFWQHRHYMLGKSFHFCVDITNFQVDNWWWICIAKIGKNLFIPVVIFSGD